MANNPRIANNTVDLGAYEGLGSNAPVLPTLRENSVIIYVDADATGTNNGGSWNNAYRDLQDAIASAPFGSEIWVAEGTYKPTSQIGDEARKVSFNLPNGVGIYGGFAGGETQLAQRSIANNRTVLSGDIGVAGDKADNTRNVVITSNTSSSTILSGFTITDGNNTGIFNIGLEPGGGIYAYESQAIFADLTIQNNTAINGGGVAVRNSLNQFINVSFIGNNEYSSLL